MNNYIKEYSVYIKLTFNVLIALYLSLYGLNSLYSFIDGFLNLSNTTNNAILMIYLLSIFLLILFYLINWYREKRINFYYLVVILLLINMFY